MAATTRNKISHCGPKAALHPEHKRENYTKWIKKLGSKDVDIRDIWYIKNSETSILIAGNSNIYERSMIITLVRDRMWGEWW